MLGQVDATGFSVGHFEVLGHGLQNEVELHEFLDSMGRPNGYKHSLLRSEAHERHHLLEDVLLLFHIKL